MEIICKCAVCKNSIPTPEGGWECSCCNGCYFDFVYELKLFLKEVSRRG